MSKKIPVESKGLIFTSTATQRNYNIYITGNIGNAEKYVNELNVLRTANENDLINLYINSGGGNFWTAMQIISAMHDCKAIINARIDGIAHSAASFIFLAADQFAVPNFVSMLCHAYTTGIYDTANKIDDWHKYIKTHLKDIIKLVYRDFLTKKEIKQLLNGKDFWFDGEEILKRVDRKIKKENKRRKRKIKNQKIQEMIVEEYMEENKE